MSDKMKCPGCESYTSSVLADFKNGDPCQYCQLPHEAAVAVLAARRRSADAELTAKYEQAITRATRAEQFAARASAFVQDLREALEHFERGGDG